MTLELTIGDQVLSAKLLDNATARDLVGLLPLSLELEDYARTEKISNLPRKLSTQGAPAGHTAKAGDLCLYAPWGNLAIFYKDAPYAEGLVLLGRLDQDLAPLRAKGPLGVTITKDR